MRCCLFLALALACIQAAWCCEKQNGCKITENNCICMYGCHLEYIYKTRRDCNNALRAMRATAPPPLSERAANICSSRPCLRGTCLQTSNAPGYTCKCEGTGFYGQRCERACPTSLIRDMVFPHECVVI